MTYSNHKKAFKQLKAKPIKLKKFLKHNLPKKRSCGRSLERCGRCGRIRGKINSYGLNMCRQCFREIATDLGFKKYS
jgi:small subunit ribosomal protein S14|tara:strand:+ start:3439 stop:3669 length:231 start_codon:yes stop_codon:yes gene_type:complete